MQVFSRGALRVVAFAACVAAAALPCSAAAQSKPAITAPKPLFRDPVHDGAADPTLIWNRARKEWWMFYTNRLADIAPAEGKDVAWVHGTRIGIAVSRDGGNHWTYHATVDVPYGQSDYTHWAPDIVYVKGRYHMFLTIVPGTFHNWNAPREIIHLVSPDLEKWEFRSKLDLGSNRVIDPSLIQLPDGSWRVWYKDEVDHSSIHYADSPDLETWTPKGVAITHHMEGPKIFRWKGTYWMITDVWDGLGVFHSGDLVHWTQQPQNILKTPGSIATDRSAGHHCDVVVNGDRAFIFYFTHQLGADTDPKVPNSASHTVLQVAELQEAEGIITVDRDAPAHVDLGHP